MRPESFSSFEEGTPEHAISQEFLNYAVAREYVVEIPNFDFYTSDPEKTDPIVLPLDEQRSIQICRTDNPGYTHRIVMNGLKDPSDQGIFLAGYPMFDTTRQDEILNEIDEQGEAEYDRLEDDSESWRREHSASRPENIISPKPGEDQFMFNQRIWDNQQKVREHSREREIRHISEMNELDRIAEGKAERKRQVLYQGQGVETSYNTIFSPALSQDNGDTSVQFEFSVDKHEHLSPSLFVPYRAIDFEEFDNKGVLKLFLSFLTINRSDIEVWDRYFTAHEDRFGIMPRLAIRSKIQSLKNTKE